MGTISYNTDRINLGYIYRATSGGTVFSANLAASTAFDYFTDTAQVNDAIYFGYNTTCFSNLYLTVGTPANANWTLAWEYYCASPAGWRPIYNLTDGSNNLTTTGAVTVKFPLQPNGFYVTINGVSCSWIRCRIASLTSITEGGANITTRVTCSAGAVSINSYTDASPCTWTAVYNWIVANAPEIGAFRWGSAFKFDNCKINIYSRLRSTNEFIFIGNGCYYQTVGLGYYHSGDKVGTNGWKNPSYLFLGTRGPTGITYADGNTKIYGGAITTTQFNNIVDGVTCYNGGYTSVGAGEYIGVYCGQGGYFGSGAVDRCTFDGNIITSSTPSVYPTNLQISDPKTNVWSMYGVPVDMDNVTYGMPTVALLYFVGGNHALNGWSNVINCKNFSPALPKQTDAVKLILRGSTSQPNPTKFLYYDSSAGTFTDYTTPAINNTVDDVPLDGDVDDCYYTQVAESIGAYQYQMVYKFVITNQTNDYQYVHEFWNGTTWQTLPSSSVYDNTNNLSQDGMLYLNTLRTFVNTTVNGINGRWIRFRIVGKGTGTPKATRIYYYGQSGIGDWRVNEIYTTKWKVQDENGNPLENATITISDSENTSNTYTTDALGTIADVDLKVKYSYFDKNASDAVYQVSTKDLSPFTIKIKKAGYETYNEIVTITSKLDKTITLKKGISNMIDTEGNLYPKLNVANDGAFRDMVIDGEIIL